jgi:hypothetical protein
MTATSNMGLRDLTTGEIGLVSGGCPIGLGPALVIFAVGFAIGFIATEAVMPIGDFETGPKNVG